MNVDRKKSLLRFWKRPGLTTNIAFLAELVRSINFWNFWRNPFWLDQSVLELIKIIGPTIAQLPQVDQVAACRKLLQFMEAEEARLLKGVHVPAATAQGCADASSPSSANAPSSVQLSSAIEQDKVDKAKDEHAGMVLAASQLRAAPSSPAQMSLKDCVSSSQCASSSLACHGALNDCPPTVHL